MNSQIIQSPQVAWASGAFSHAPLIRKTTRIQDLTAVFAGMATILNTRFIPLKCLILLPERANSGRG